MLDEPGQKSFLQRNHLKPNYFKRHSVSKRESQIQTQGNHLHHKYISVSLCKRNSLTVEGHSLPLLNAYSSKSFQVL